MIEPLQGFGFRESNYERPNQNWECGWACEGEPCHIGPNHKGICQAHRECVPYREGGRFCCARPQNFGGSCEREHGGPLPNGMCSQRVMECQPVRTLRNRRHLFTIAVAAMALGVCLVMFGGSWGKSFSSPGDLTRQHRPKDHTCKDCHSAADGEFEHGDLAQWASGALTSEMSSGDTVLCLKCHSELKPNRQLAHGLSTQALKLSSERIRQSSGNGSEPVLLSLVEATVGNPQDLTDGLACARCHHEHRGRDFDLTQMTNNQCQSCHSSKFHSFSNGHPQFTGFPYGRRPRLHFDHATHYRVHFAAFRRIKPNAQPSEILTPIGEGGSPNGRSCYTCHQPDTSGMTMPVRSFEQSCAACHGAEIGDDSLPGIDFFSLPRLDGNHELYIGEWPTLPEAPANLDNISIPPLMDLLLSSDPELAAICDTIRDGGLKMDNKQDRAVIESYLLGVKQMISDLTSKGRPEFQRRLRIMLDSHIASSKMKLQLSALLGANSADPNFIDALTTVQKRWFPNLAEELAQHNKGTPLDSKPSPGDPKLNPDDPKPGDPTLADASNSGWYATEEKGSIHIRYRVTGHADSLVRTWLDVIGQIPNILDEPDQTETNEDSNTVAVQRALSSLFGVLSDRTAAYRCLDCHTADKRADGRLKINWFGKRTDPEEHSFTKFSHAPHVKVLGKEKCDECHYTQSKVADIKFFRPEFVKVQENWAINTNPHSTHLSGFAPLAKQACAKCHTSQKAGDSCLKCHNYHIHR